jgi:tetratricopeptide (TPR) repeat protein
MISTLAETERVLQEKDAKSVFEFISKSSKEDLAKILTLAEVTKEFEAQDAKSISRFIKKFSKDELEKTAILAETERAIQGKDAKSVFEFFSNSTKEDLAMISTLAETERAIQEKDARGIFEFITKSPKEDLAMISTLAETERAIQEKDARAVFEFISNSSKEDLAKIITLAEVTKEFEERDAKSISRFIKKFSKDELEKTAILAETERAIQEKDAREIFDFITKKPKEDLERIKVLAETERAIQEKDAREILDYITQSSKDDLENFAKIGRAIHKKDTKALFELISKPDEELEKILTLSKTLRVIQEKDAKALFEYITKSPKEELRKISTLAETINTIHEKDINAILDFLSKLSKEDLEIIEKHKIIRNLKGTGIIGLTDEESGKIKNALDQIRRLGVVDFDLPKADQIEELKKMQIILGVAKLMPRDRSEIIEKLEMVSTPLFSWDNIPGNDNQRLLMSLKDDFDMRWVEGATISKKGDESICISKGKNSAEIILAKGKDKAILKNYSNDTSHDLEVKKDNDKLTISLTPFKNVLKRMGNVELAGRVKEIESQLKIESLYRKGCDLLNKKAYEGAKNCFDELTRKNPDLKGAWLNLGVALGKLGKIEDEIVCYEMALGIDETYGKALRNRDIAQKKIKSSTR